MHAIGEGAHGTMAKDNVDELQDWITMHRPVDRALQKEQNPSPPKKVQLKCPPKQTRGRGPTKVLVRDKKVCALCVLCVCSLCEFYGC